jgi:rhodanese-related sulfurtransferase
MKKLIIVTLLLLFIFPVVLSGCDYITGAAPELSFNVPEHTPTIQNVSSSDGYAIISINAGHANFVIIDVRTPSEYAQGHIPFAINLDVNSPTFIDEINKYNKNKTYFIYCQAGGRSASARDIMKDLGFQNIINLTIGYADWVAVGFPVVK